jgi:hypothetical protein
MAFSIYDASVPVLLKALDGLDNVLDKGAASAEARKIEWKVFAQARLYPDMLPLCAQVWLATEMAARGVSRLAGSEIPNYPYEGESLEELKARIELARNHIKGFGREQIEGGEDRTFTAQLGPNAVEFNGRDYLTRFTLPNVYFHVTTAYDILRHNGVQLTKTDYTGGFS